MSTNITLASWAGFEALESMNRYQLVISDNCHRAYVLCLLFPALTSVGTGLRRSISIQFVINNNRFP